MLAVLVLATLWKGRFPDGWVTDEEFGTFSLHIPYPRKETPTRRETIKRYVRGALGALPALNLQAVVERRPVPSLARVGDKRERVTRLKQPVRPRTHEWFHRSGLFMLNDGARRAFDDNCYGSFATSEVAGTALMEAVVYSLVDRGEFDKAASHAYAALKSASSDHERRTFELALASIDLGRKDRAAIQPALDRLRSLARGSPSLETQPERVLQGRILTTLATGLALLEFERLTHETEEARAQLTKAQALIPPQSLPEQGDLLFAEAIIQEQESLFHLVHTRDREKGYELRHRAAETLLSAMTAWRLGQRWDRLRHGLLFLGSIPQAMKLSHLEGAHLGTVVRWLKAARDYFAVVAPHERHALGSVCYNILWLFDGLPKDCDYAALPLPPEESYHLVNACFPHLPSNERHFARVRRSKWYIEMKRKQGRSS